MGMVQKTHGNSVAEPACKGVLAMIALPPKRGAFYREQRVTINRQKLQLDRLRPNVGLAPSSYVLLDLKPQLPPSVNTINFPEFL